MKKGFAIILTMSVFLLSCEKEDINKFDETSDQRVTRAISELKQHLTAPANGWKLKYNPVSGTGSYNVLLNFNENNKVRIRTDLSVNDGEFYDQTIFYRIDNSLGLELIFENYSFFSFLFEQNAATFGAEFEFNFVNKTPDGALVFSSKSDVSNPTTLTFLPATDADQNILGVELSNNLNLLSSEVGRISSSMVLTFSNIDLAFYLSINPGLRTIEFSYVSQKSNNQAGQLVNFSSGYTIEGDMLVLDNTLSGTFLAQAVSIKSITFSELAEASSIVCGNTTPVHSYSGNITSSNEPVTLQNTMFDIRGQLVFENASFLYCPLGNILKKSESAYEEVLKEIPEAENIQLYHQVTFRGFDRVVNGMGISLINKDGSSTFAFKEFTYSFEENRITFNFSPDFYFIGNANPDADLSKVNALFNNMTQGNQTYIYQYSEGVYEFYNPCTEWAFIFVAVE